jgi:hypothetical protein
MVLMWNPKGTHEAHPLGRHGAFAGAGRAAYQAITLGQCGMGIPECIGATLGGVPMYCGIGAVAGALTCVLWDGLFSD